jgi:hypothetical protein
MLILVLVLVLWLRGLLQVLYNIEVRTLNANLGIGVVLEYLGVSESIVFFAGILAPHMLKGSFLLASYRLIC